MRIYYVLMEIQMMDETNDIIAGQNRSWFPLLTLSSPLNPELQEVGQYVVASSDSGHNISSLVSSESRQEDEVPNDDVELLIVQAWRTDTEGELLGILFEQVRDGHLEPITSEVLVFLAQPVDDLPLDILSRCEERSTPAALPRTFTPQLLWSTCTELDDDNIYLPSSGDYLVIDVTSITLWDLTIRRVEVGKGEEEEEEAEEEEREDTNEEEEDSEAGSDDPDYRESVETGSEGSGLDESGGSGGQSEEEDEAAAQRRQEKA
ncbi:hypothetical protein CBR_g22473 [Chara braunii]|uniref:Uncharacterized protein n=1 Tax=Chara braunii TaxID=69332 RepID=A0A388L2P4_CHABU|nr:hypothetical protein CBR_g22473 [Chara braunii]|eukprot:GBG76594.1 hypothetical protein CBR_g22473 [Chara braunii]